MLTTATKLFSLDGALLFLTLSMLSPMHNLLAFLSNT